MASLVGLLVAALVFTLVGSSLIRSQTETAARRELDRQTRALAELIGNRAERAARAGRPFETYDPSGLAALVGKNTRLRIAGLELSPGASEPNGRIPTVVVDRLDYDVLADIGLQRLDYVEPGTGRFTEASAAPLEIGDTVVGAILLARPPGRVGTPWTTVASRATAAAALGFGAALVILLFLTGRMTRPLLEMQTASRQVARGNLDARVEPGGTVELDDMAAAFNAMVRQLARRDAMTRDFLMRITHDLRTPLTAIRGHAAALSDGVVPEEQIPRSLSAIEGEAGRLEAMVTDLLDLARLDAEQFRLQISEVDASELLDQAVAAHEAEAAQRGIEYRSRVERMPVFETDGVRVRQIVGNLIENALRWTPAGGSVTLTGGMADGRLDVEVRDTGAGIPGDRQEAVFQPFQSDESPDGRRGSGLGLAISRQLARALGGDLTLESSPGTGSTFMLSLPVKVADGDQRRARRRRASLMRAGGEQRER